MGRYRPPEMLDSSLSGPRSSKRRETKGPPTIRFEMPFAIWCTTCDPEEIIGQGVRFNAQKIRVGNYHTTPIWAFEMRHGACGGLIEIRTDPAIGDYVVEKGARKRDYGPGVGLTEIGVDRDKKDGSDPFAGVEGRTEMEVKTKSANQRVEALQQHVDRKWEDPFAANRRLRGSFRVERKTLKEKETERVNLADRLGLSLDILDSTEEDGRRAAHVDFGRDKADAHASILSSQARPLFESDGKPLTAVKKGGGKGSTKLTGLQRSLQNSTRALMDPFLVDTGSVTSKAIIIAGIKRKREEAAQAPNLTPEKVDATNSLVAYLSDGSDG
jgi:coiled-coil domain-containing protein 130